jgi:hypothetical protein
VNVPQTVICLWKGADVNIPDCVALQHDSREWRCHYNSEGYCPDWVMWNGSKFILKTIYGFNDCPYSETISEDCPGGGQPNQMSSMSHTLPRPRLERLTAEFGELL